MNTALPPSYAQHLPAGQAGIFLPSPGAMVRLSPSFNPSILKGIKVYPDNPFVFDFILDNGDQKSDQEEASKLIRYFLASLTTPENDMWVNLSPYEKDRIVPESFGQTEMGRDLLAQDYLLKQITASLIYPEDEIGKKFWERIRVEAKKKFGTTDIPVNTFNKVWIVPAKAVVYENLQSASAYVIESKLKVMLEEDYVALSNQKDSAKSPAAAGDVASNALGSQIVREIVIPALTKEVNEGKNFSQLRQVYNSLILAAWYKKKIKDSILSQVYIDRNKVAGVDIDDPQEKQIIYEQYLEAFKKGAYNYIKEEYDPLTQESIPRKYFSGGFSATAMDMKDVLLITTSSSALAAARRMDDGNLLQVELAPWGESYQEAPLTLDDDNIQTQHGLIFYDQLNFIASYMKDLAQQLVVVPGEKSVFRRFFLGRKVINIGPQNNTRGSQLVAQNLMTEMRERGIDAVALAPADPHPSWEQGVFQKGSVEDMPYADNSFDDVVTVALFDPAYWEMVLSSQLNQTVEQRQALYPKVVSEMRRVLKPGGRIYFNPVRSNPLLLENFVLQGFKVITVGEDLEFPDLGYVLINQKVTAASSSITSIERADLLVSIEDRFEKPHSVLVQKPERELNERVAERTSSVEIQMEIDRLLAELGMIIFQYQNPALQEPDLRDRESEFLQRLRSLYMSMPILVKDDQTFEELSQVLKDLRASRNRIYNAIEKADRAKNSEALKDLNQQAIRNNRLVLKAQLLIAGKMITGKSSLKNKVMALFAVRETIRGALNSAQLLEEELGYRIGRLRAAEMVREIETADWLGNIVRTFRMSGFDISVAPSVKAEGEPEVTIRQQHWINVHTRLSQALTDLRAGRIAAARERIDGLIAIYNVKDLIVYEKYQDIANSLRAVRGKMDGLIEGQALNRGRSESLGSDISQLKILITNPKQRVWVDIGFEDIDAAFRGYIHRFSGYVEDIGVISRNKTTLEFFATKLKIAQKAGYLSQRNQTILLEGMAPIVAWAQRGFVVEKQRVVIDLQPAVEKIIKGDHEGAQADIDKAVVQLEKRLKDIESIVAKSKRQAASVFAAFRDKDIAARAAVVQVAIEQRQFGKAFNELNNLIELYFNQDQVEPGYLRAVKSLREITRLIRAAQRSRDPSKLIAQAQAYFKIAAEDLTHKYSLKIYFVEDSGKKTFAYVNPGTTVAGFVKSRGHDPRAVQVTFGKGWIKSFEFGLLLSEENTVVIKASSALADVSPARVRRNIQDNVDYTIRLLEATRNSYFNSGFANYEYTFYRGDAFGNTSFSAKFLQYFQEIQDPEEIKAFALALNVEWKDRGFDKDFGSLFEYVAELFSDYGGSAARIKRGYQWFYHFLEVASPMDRALALRLLVVSFANHLRSGGLHPEGADSSFGLSPDKLPLDQELLLGNRRDLVEPQIFQRYILSLLELEKTQSWSEVLKGENGELNKLGLTHEDIFLWALILLIDPTVYEPWTLSENPEEAKEYLTQYFGKPVTGQKAGSEFLRQAFAHASLQEYLPRVEVLLEKAMKITDDQWMRKGQRSPFKFAFALDNLKVVLADPLFWEGQFLRMVGNPMLMLGFESEFFPEKMRTFLEPASGGKKHVILKRQAEIGLRPLYVTTFTSPEMAAILPNLSRTLKPEQASSPLTAERQRELDAIADQFMINLTFGPDLRRVTQADEITYLGRAINVRWNAAGLDKTRGPFFTFLAIFYSEEYTPIDPNDSKVIHDWVYQLIEAADPLERNDALWAMVVSGSAHLRRLGLHPEEQPSLVFLDQELLLRERGLLERFLTSFEELSSEQLTQRIKGPAGSDFNREDLLLWGLLLALDPTTYSYSVDLNDDKLSDILGQYFGDNTTVQTAAARFMSRAFEGGKLKDNQWKIEALLSKAFAITEQEWEAKGLRSPYQFGLQQVYLKTLLKTESVIDAFALTGVENPVYAFAVDLKNFSQTVQEKSLVKFTGIPVIAKLTGVDVRHNRESYVTLYRSPALASVFPRFAAMLTAPASASAAVLAENPYIFTNFDARIPVEGELLDLFDQDLERMKKTLTSTGEIYFNREEFERAGIFYKVMLLREVTADEQRYLSNNDISPEKIQAAMIKEANVLMALNRAGVERVPTIMSHGKTTDGRIYIKLRGLPLSQTPVLSEAFQDYSFEKKIAFLRRVAETLASLHDQNVTHYDVKIENIIVSQETDEPMIIDFGESEPATASMVANDISKFKDIITAVLSSHQVALLQDLIFEMRVYGTEFPSYMHTVAVKLQKIEDGLVASARLRQSNMVFPAGGRLFTRYPVNEEFLKASNGKERLSDDSAGEFKLAPSEYVYLETPLDIIRSELGVDLVEKIEELDQQRERSESPDRTITVLDWGAGAGTSLVEIKTRLEKRGIRNVRLVGFSHVPHRKWLDLPSGVDMIFGKDKEISDYFRAEEIDMIYSYSALSLFVYGDYFKQLASLMRPGGKIFWDGQAEDVKNVKATGLRWGFEPSELKFSERAYYLQKPLVASAGVEDNATKGGIDFQADKLNLETQSSGGEIKFEMDPQQLLEFQNVPGFMPVIINIQPLNSVQLFLGLKEDSETQFPLYSQK